MNNKRFKDNKHKYNFWLVFVPFHLLAFVGLFYALDNLFTLFVLWFVIGVIGNGVAAHRYFAHGQFETYNIIRWVLGFIATLSAIGPLPYWVMQHRVHHARSDKSDDPHTPVGNSWFYVFYSWSFPKNVSSQHYLRDRYAKRLAVRLGRDPLHRFFYHAHYPILYVWCAILFIINPVYLYLYCLAYAIDFFRLGAVNYYCHGYGYRNHNTPDRSTNNIWLGYLGMGFGWHNTHHAHPGKLILTERWYEIDVEGLIGKLLSKPRSKK